MSSNYYRRGRNPTTAFGILFIIIGSIALVRQIILWSVDFAIEFLLNNEVTSEKIAVATICIGIIITFWGFRKNDQER